MSKKTIGILFEKLRDKIQENLRIAKLNAVRCRNEWEKLAENCIYRNKNTGQRNLAPFKHEDMPVLYTCGKVNEDMDSDPYYVPCKFENCLLIKK